MVIAFYSANPRQYKKSGIISTTKILNLFNDNKLGFFENFKIPNFQKEIFEYILDFEVISEEVILNHSEKIINKIKDNPRTIYIAEELGLKNDTLQNRSKYTINLFYIIKEIIKNKSNLILFNNNCLDVIKNADYIITDTKTKNGSKDFGYTNEDYDRYVPIFDFFKKNLIDIRYSEGKINIPHGKFYLIKNYSETNKYKYWIFKKSDVGLNIENNFKIDIDYAKELIKWVEKNFLYPLEINKKCKNFNCYYSYNIDYSVISSIISNIKEYSIFEVSLYEFLEIIYKLDYLKEVLELFESDKYERTKYQKSAIKLESFSTKLLKMLKNKENITSEILVQIYINRLKYINYKFNLNHLLYTEENKKKLAKLKTLDYL